MQGYDQRNCLNYLKSNMQSIRLYSTKIIMGITYPGKHSKSTYVGMQQIPRREVNILSLCITEVTFQITPILHS